MGSADLLAALLRNLLDNALRCSPEGSAIRVEVREAGGTVSVIVEDSGPGIPAAERERVFARFYRLDDGSGPGCGLGLSIVSRIAALHRGTVALTDGAGGRGLRVCVDLPAAGIRR
jgi:signal transduction histidine kinase